jgi:hypothetical protein
MYGRVLDMRTEAAQAVVSGFDGNGNGWNRDERGKGFLSAEMMMMMMMMMMG